MKSIIFTVLVLVVLASPNVFASSKCAAVKCAAKDAPCNNPATVCLIGQQYCNANTSKCTDFLEENQACVAGGPVDQCGELACQPSSSGSYTCRPIVYRLDPGEVCTADEQCYFKDTNAHTTHSTCVNGQCYGIQLGGSCDSYGQCVTGLYCSDTGNCVALKVNGADCSEKTECVSGSCVPKSTTSTESICVPFQSVVDKGYCGVTEDCIPGYYCSFATDDAEWGVCKVPAASSNTACASDNDCAYPESCGCDTLTGSSKCVAPHVRPSQLADAEYSYSICLMQNKCNSTQCILEKCSKELCAYNSILYGPSVWNSNIVNFACVYGEVAASAFAKCASDELSSSSQAVDSSSVEGSSSHSSDSLDAADSSHAGNIISESSDALLLLPALVFIGCSAVVILAF